MKCLLLFIGESFRCLKLGRRNRGSEESYDSQMSACKSHIDFIEYIISKFNIDVSVYVATYKTQYDVKLLDTYNKYLIGYDIHDNVIGLNNLFHSSINVAKYIGDYDFIFYIRIDLFLKKYFMDIFDPYKNMILFPTITCINTHKVNGHPRVSDTMIFIPKKYFSHIPNFEIFHYCWYILVTKTNLTYDDMDTMINTFHDSDTSYDYNPLYYMVNREEINVFRSEGFYFDKHKFHLLNEQYDITNNF